MPRPLRLGLPGLPLHVTQRGVNRCAAFFDDDDRHHYRWLLRAACQKHVVAIHAYGLMDKHVHLLLTPAEAGALSRAMQAVGQKHKEKRVRFIFIPAETACHAQQRGRR